MLGSTPKKPRPQRRKPKNLQVVSEEAQQSEEIQTDQSYIFYPNPGPQTEFLSSSEQEVLYGGAAGGGKSYSLVADPVRYFDNPDFKGLLLRRTTEELRELVSISHKLYPALYGKRAHWVERDKTWYFDSGATFWMSYLERDQDAMRYQGQAFCVAAGTKVRLGDNKLKKVEDLQVGDSVQTLEGPQAVLYRSPKLQKKCVKVSVFSSDGHLLSEQIQPDSHPIALLSSKPFQQLGDLSRSISKFQTHPLQWLSYKHLESERLESREIYVSQEDGQNDYKESEGDSQEAPLPHGSFYPAVRFSPDLLPDQVRAPTQYCKFCKCYVQSEGLRQGTLTKTLGPLPPYELFEQSTGHTSLSSHPSCGGESGGLIGTKIVEGSPESYCSCNCPCGEQSLLSQEADQGDVLTQVGAEGLGLSYLHSGEMGCTHVCNRYHAERYTHPYTQEQRELKVPLELCIVHVEPLPDPLSSVYDLTVNLSNNYITETGLVNKNCWIGFDELTQWPTPYAWNYLRSRLRTTSASGLPLCSRATSNPGGPGHSWVKKMFVDPASPGKAFWATDIETGEVLRWPDSHSMAGKPLFKRKFIPATLFDNPYLSQDGNYEANLLSLPENERKRLLYGDWDVAEGAAFSEWNRKIHVIEPFEIPANWMRFRACDYGYGSFAFVIWLAVDPATEQLIVYREMKVKKVLAVDLADMVLEAEAGERIRYGMLDSSLWHKRGDTGPSLAEQMLGRGCSWRPSDRSGGSRVAGKNELHRRLQVDPFTEMPRIVFFSTCTNIISELPSISLDKTNPEDVNTKGDDHGYDALRYAVMSRPRGYTYDNDPYATVTEDNVSDLVFGY